jgi:hypothetical protein
MDEHVRLRGELFEYPLPRVGRHIERETPFVAVETGEIRRKVFVSRGEVSRQIAVSRAFDLDHVGAEIAQYLCRQRADECLCAVDYSNVLKRSHARKEFVNQLKIAYRHPTETDT